MSAGTHVRNRHARDSGLGAGGAFSRPTHGVPGFNVMYGDGNPSDSLYDSQVDVEPITMPDLTDGIIDGGVHIYPASLTKSLFASSIVPPTVETALPALPDPDYPQGSLVFLTTDEKLYRNTDGSTWSVAVDGADIVANSVTAGQIAAGAIGATELAAELVLASVIKTADTGQRLELDINGLRSYNVSEEVEVQLPTDGSAVYVKGQIQATELLVLGDAVLSGSGNALAMGSVTALEAQRQAPSQKPTLAQGWETISMPLAQTWGDSSDTTANRLGGDYSTTGGAGGATAVIYMATFATDGNWRILELLASDRTLNRSVQVTSLDDSEFLLGWCRHSSWLYCLINNGFLGTYYVRRYLASTLAEVDTFSSVDFPITPRSPGMASDGTNLYIVDKSTGTATIRWNKYNDTMVKQGATINTGYSSGSNDNILDVAAGNFDFGAFRMAVLTCNGDVVDTFDSTGARQANEQFPVAASSTLLYGSLFYGDVLGDGARFWSVQQAGSAVSLTKHTNWVWTTASPIYWVGYTWYDSNATGGTHETTVGPRQSITMGRRKRLTVTMASVPGAGGVDDPDTRRVYMFPNATAPATTSLDLQGQDAVGSMQLDTYDSGGAAPPVANNFPAGTPAELKSGAGEWSLKGDGSAQFNKLRMPVTVDATVSSTDHPLQIGNDSGDNVVFDNNEIMARSNGAFSTLYLNKDGGGVAFAGETITMTDTGALAANGSVSANADAESIVLSNNNYIEMTERAAGDPAAPANTFARLYLRDNAGKTQLVCRFNTGAIQVVAAEP